MKVMIREFMSSEESAGVYLGGGGGGGGAFAHLEFFSPPFEFPDIKKI